MLHDILAIFKTHENLLNIVMKTRVCENMFSLLFKYLIQ